MKKKNIKVKKGNGDISITIENNLNANNKQINHQPIKRRRRKKKIEDTEEINKVPNIPLKDVSYIKPGPVGAFKIWQNTMPQLPAPPTQPALTAPEQQQMITFDNWQRAMTTMREQQQKPPVSWGREMVDDDEPRMPASPVFSVMSRANDLEDYDDFAKDVEDSVAEVYRLENNDPDLESVSKEVQQIINLTQARRLGTIHGKKKLLPENIRQTEFYNKIKDTTAYKTAYEKAFNTIRQPPQEFSEINEDTEVPRTRAGKKKVQINDALKSGVSDRSRQRERERLKRELEELNKQIPDFGDFENWNEEKELAKAGLKPIIMTNEDTDEEVDRLLFAEF